MKKNLVNNKIETVFLDCTYKIIPPRIKGYKFLVIIGYENINDKLYALIPHENKENFEKVFNYLKIKYDFEPKYITSDYHKGQISAIISTFNNSKIILCWFML